MQCTLGMSSSCTVNVRIVMKCKKEIYMGVGSVPAHKERKTICFPIRNTLTKCQLLSVGSIAIDIFNSQASMGLKGAECFAEGSQHYLGEFDQLVSPLLRG